jgi:hypothetical protein
VEERGARGLGDVRRYDDHLKRDLTAFGATSVLGHLEEASEDRSLQACGTVDLQR